MTSHAAVPEYATGGEEPVPVELLPFRSPAPQMPWWERDDPYYEPELFDDQPRWEYRSTTVDTFRPNAAGQVRKVKAREPDFKALPARAHTARRPLQAVAALGQFHHMTTSQAAAVGGWNPTQVGRVLTPLWSAGLLERAKFVPQEVVGPRAPLVWQLRASTELRQFQRDLDHQRWAAVTLGLNLATSGARNYVRHNLLATEIMLRSLETIPTICGAWGEPLCDPYRLLPPGHPARPDSLASWRADLCLLREDGFRILIEVTAGTSEQAIRPKIRRWAKFLTRTTLNDAGFAVVFLNAAPPGRHEHLAATLRRIHESVVSFDGLAERGAPVNPDQLRRIRSQLLVGSWREWFPAIGSISERFAHLRCGYTADGSTWRTVDVADPSAMPFQPRDPLAWIDAVVNAGIAAHTPTWAGGPVASELHAGAPVGMVG